MSYHDRNHTSRGFGLALLVGAIYFAFGANAARTVVQFSLLAVAAFVLYIGFRVVMGTI